MANSYDLYGKIAKEENISRQAVKMLAFPILYGTRSQGQNLENEIRKTVQTAKKMGVITQEK